MRLRPAHHFLYAQKIETLLSLRGFFARLRSFKFYFRLRKRVRPGNLSCARTNRSLLARTSQRLKRNHSPRIRIVEERRAVRGCSAPLQAQNRMRAQLLPLAPGNFLQRRGLPALFVRNGGSGGLRLKF